MASVFGKKALIITLTIIFLLLNRDVKRTCTYILQSTNHELLSGLYLGETEGLECT